LSGAPTVHTVGHSTRGLEELVGLLEAFEIRLVFDVRRFPGSRRYPHFGRDTLAASLSSRGIEYRHEPDLGGRRSPRPGSPNHAWRAAAFRGYADHMATPEFESAIQRVAESCSQHPAVMCAEAVPWRCHRQLIADALVARGIEVHHILGRGQTMPHALHPQARVTAEGRIVYDLPAAGPLPLFSRSGG
jgi:uncharacterized protein (DUF488 family)